ncbi:TPA: hypothetical protein ACJFS2_000074 [Escherichia coli]
MTTYNTGNPLGSSSAKDLYDNAQNFDHLSNDQSNELWPDRFGNPRLTWHGMEIRYQEKLASMGWTLIDSFQDGANLTRADEALHWKIPDGNGEYYRWDGAFPKNIPANSTPDSTGGIGVGAWIGIGDASLRAALSNTDGSELIGYKNPQSQVIETLKIALDKINVRLIYAVDFGVKTDGSDNADALWELGQFISNATDPLYVIFPHGTSLVGSQEFAGATGKGYSYRPSYESRTWSDASAMGWFSIHQTNNDITLDMTGWTLKANDGMKHGSFDPVTGAVASDQISETPNRDYLAYQGYLIKIFMSPNTKINGGITDGNLKSSSWGGKYGNIGYQVPSYNMWVNQSEGIKISQHVFKNSPVDGLYMQATGERSYLDIVPNTVVDTCFFQDCGRNCYSLTGGANIDIINPVITRSGSLATDIGTHFSGPEAGIDIEAEGGNPYNIRIHNPKIVNTGKCALMTVSVPGKVNDITVYGGVIQSFSSQGAVSNSGASRNIKFKNVTIIGGIIDIASPVVMGLEAYHFENCDLQNRYGNGYAVNYLLSFPVSYFHGNTITFGIPETTVSAATINITDQDRVSGGLYAERFKNNRLIVYGNAANITFVNGLGGLNNFKNAELFVSSDGLTGGSAKLLVDSSSSGISGLSTNTINFNFGSSIVMDKDAGRNIWYARKSVRLAGVVSPTADNGSGVGVQDIGGASVGRFRTGYFDSGVIVRDGVTGTHYRVRVTSGTLNVVVEET